MAEDSSKNLAYIVAIEQKHSDYLGNIRHWSNLKIASKDGTLWIKDITYLQIISLEIKSIPYIKLYCIKENKLFPLGSNLPLLKLPSLLWTPIEIGLSVKLPKQNNNFFGIQETLDIKITPSLKEYEPFALCTFGSSLKNYIESAPEVRLKNLSWIILDQTRVLILGSPILPINGISYWMKNNFLIPTGYDFELNILSNEIDKSINKENNWILWNLDGTYLPIDKNKCCPLSISSVRLSESLMNVNLVS